jgi:hypothetical protein
LSVIGLLLVYFFVFQRSPKPDLLIANAAGTCVRSSANPQMLQITVKNNSSANISVATRTLTEFNVTPISGGYTSIVPYSHTVASLSANQTTDLLFALPTPCIQGSSSGYTCSYRVTVDADKALDEANENNNAFSGTCP